MQRKFESKTRGELFVERVVWNAAAGAALAVMVLLLLFTLQWLDRISPHVAVGRSLGEPVEIARPVLGNSMAIGGPTASAMPAMPTTEVAAVNRPSG